ncbi:hypothetical protein ABZS77_09415 [Micromonospora sp. NPDC005298]|uniref:hypothetical protein n=1 Tax=Micromonospora sp. NPDC005298 TaxID=3156873 RepID=UPI0033ABC638
MLNVRYVHAHHDVTQEKFRLYLEGMLEHDKWRPAALTAERSFAQMAGLPSEKPLQFSSRRYRGTIGMPARGAGDVFFRSGVIVSITNVREPKRPEDRYSYEIMEYSPAARLATLRQSILIGIVSKEDVDAEEILNDFLEAFEEQVATHTKSETPLKWEPIGLESPRLVKLLEKLTPEGAATRFSNPDLSDETVEGADVLSVQPNRELLRELSEAGFGREADILSRRGEKREEVQAALADLAAAGLTHAEFLLACRATSAPLARFPTAEETQTGPIAAVRCGKCTRTYSQELLSEGYSVSKLGRSLAQGSHWMTVWVTKRLVNLGIPLTSIVWNLEESSEEVDIIIELMSKLWIFELKDREFGPGDAHPFNYRRVRYGADEAFVITTDKVSADAKRVFGDLAGDSSGRTRTKPPTMIEGLENVEKEIRKHLELASYQRAVQALVMPSMMVGFALDGVIAEWVPSSSLPSGLVRHTGDLNYYI